MAIDRKLPGKAKLPGKSINCPFCFGKMEKTGKILKGYDPHLKEYECRRCRALIYSVEYSIEKSLVDTP